MSATADQELAELRHAYAELQHPNAELRCANAGLRKERDTALAESQALTTALAQRNFAVGP